MSPKTFCFILPHEKSLFLMLFKDSIFVAKSGINLPYKFASLKSNSNCLFLVGAFTFLIFSLFLRAGDILPFAMEYPKKLDNS